MSGYYGFKVSEIFPSDDVVSEWLATLSIAFNDMSLAHIQLVNEDAHPERFFYWLRLALSHFVESLVFLDATKNIAGVEAFVAALPRAARANYEECLKVYANNKTELHRIRSQTTFHYPTLRVVEGQRRRRPMQAVLHERSADRGVIRMGKVRDARLLFADDFVATMFMEASGGSENVDRLHTRLSDGIQAFMRFVNPALEAHFAAAQERGASLESVKPVDADDPRKGWKVVSSGGE